ncbi:MAG: DUF4921 family protein [Pirellulaceae bacterium]|nr:DUF4921 family protein [Pirellulaceae bacterium]
MLDTAELNSQPPRSIAEFAQKHSASSRFDPITGNWTIFAPNRDQRPNDYKKNPSKTRTTINQSALECPFCGGAEDETPTAVWVGRNADDQEVTSQRVATNASHLLQPGRATTYPRAKTTHHCNSVLATTQCTDDPAVIDDLSPTDWSVRVVPNKFPAITDHREERRRPAPANDLFREQEIVGGHEVIIESPSHHQSLLELDTANFALVFAAYRDRIRYWNSIPGIKYISVFKNSGGEAGASIAHSHSQLIASNMMPTRVRATLERVNKYRAQTGCCLQCNLLRAELKAKKRIVARAESLVAYCPFASRMPMLVRITTTDHESRFDQLTDHTIESVSKLVKRVASWIERAQPGVAYNYLLRTLPPGAQDHSQSFHWSLEIFPRMTSIAGFEFSSDCMINPVLPENAANQYRSYALAESPRVVL